MTPQKHYKKFGLVLVQTSNGETAELYGSFVSCLDKTSIQGFCCINLLNIASEGIHQMHIPWSKTDVLYVSTKSSCFKHLPVTS